MIWIELTSPWETNMPKRHVYKINRSNQLAIDLRKGKYFGVKWTVLPFYVEIGARGAVYELNSCNTAYNRMCSKLGFTGKARDRTQSTGNAENRYRLDLDTTRSQRSSEF